MKLASAGRLGELGTPCCYVVLTVKCSCRHDRLLLLLLLQACQSSLNTAGLALIMQTVATGLLVTACIANEDYSGALGDGIQVGGACCCVFV